MKIDLSKILNDPSPKTCRDDQSIPHRTLETTGVTQIGASRNEHTMPISQNSLDSELELRWRTWLDKGKRADRLADKRMKVLFSVVGVILLVWILVNAF